MAKNGQNSIVLLGSFSGRSRVFNKNLIQQTQGNKRVTRVPHSNKTRTQSKQPRQCKSGVGTTLWRSPTLALTQSIISYFYVVFFQLWHLLWWAKEEFWYRETRLPPHVWPFETRIHVMVGLPGLALTQLDCCNELKDIWTLIWESLNWCKKTFQCPADSLLDLKEPWRASFQEQGGVLGVFFAINGSDEQTS